MSYSIPSSPTLNPQYLDLITNLSETHKVIPYNSEIHQISLPRQEPDYWASRPIPFNPMDVRGNPL